MDDILPLIDLGSAQSALHQRPRTEAVKRASVAISGQGTGAEVLQLQ